MPDPLKILVAVDRSEFSNAVVDMTLRIAAADGTRVLLVNVAPREADLFGQQLKRKVITDPVPEELREHTELLDRLAGVLDAAGVQCETLLIRGEAGATILREARRWGADLIVVGSHGRGMIQKRLLGSVSEEVLRDRSFPVLVVSGPAGNRNPSQTAS